MSKSQQFERHIPSIRAQTNLKLQGLRQRGFVAAKYGRPRMSEEQLRDIGDEAAVRAYGDGWRVGEREGGR